MSSGISPFGRTRRASRATVMAAMLVLSAAPAAVSSEVTLDHRDVADVLDTAAHWFHSKDNASMRQAFVTLCYFDPNVGGSMGCSAVFGEVDAQLYQIRQTAKRMALKECRTGGGRKCVLFLQNGELRFDGLSAVEKYRLRNALERISFKEPEPRSIPASFVVADSLRDDFEHVTDYLEDVRKRLRGRNLHYSICSGRRNLWTWTHVTSQAATLSDARSMCISKCRALGDYYSIDGDCYAIYEDGGFVSAEAERATRR